MSWRLLRTAKPPREVMDQRAAQASQYYLLVQFPTHPMTVSGHDPPELGT